MLNRALRSDWMPVLLIVANICAAVVLSVQGANLKNYPAGQDLVRAACVLAGMGMFIAIIATIATSDHFKKDK